MPIRSVTLRILGESKDALAKMKAVNAEADKLEARKVNVKVGVDLDQKSLIDVKAKLTALSKFKTDIPLTFKIDGLTEALAKIKTELAAMRTFVRSNPIDVQINSSGNLDQLIRTLHNNFDMLSHDLVVLRQKTDETNSHLGGLVSGLGKVRGGLKETADTAATTGAKMGALFTGGGGWGLFGRIAFGKVALFGGLAGAIGGLHLLIDTIVEVAAVWIPATIAAGAFGIAASDAVMTIIHHMTNLHTVADATGQAIPPMTNAMEKLHNAVRPSVYQAFGDALTVINQKSGLFSKLAMGASQVVDQLAARMAVAVTHGHGLNDFMANAVSDLSKLGNAFGDLFGIIGNLLRAVPGYAQILLDFGGGFLKLLEYVTRIGEPFIHLGLVVHGFIVWAGLGATAAFGISKALIFLGNTAIGAAVKSFGVFLFTLAEITFSAGVTEGAMFALSAAMTAIQANPLIWVGAAIGALGALIFWMASAKSSTQAWGDSLQKTIDDSSSVTQGIDNLRRAQILTGNNLNKQTQELAHTQQYGMQVNLHTGMASRQVTAQFRNQTDAVAQARDQYNRFNQEAQFSTGRLNGLAKAYGGQKNAMALVHAAGITESEWQDHSAEGWAIIIQRINGTIQGYKAMGQAGGTLNNDLSVMDKYTTDQYNAMQKLNQAWSTFTGELTGGQQAFDTVAQGLNVLGNNSATASRHLGNAKIASVGLGHAMDGLKSSDIALNQAFTTQIGNVSNLFATWRTAGIASGEFTTGVKAAIEPMVKYAKGSQEATAQLVGLAEQAGYSGPISLSRLTKWLGNTSNATAKVKAVTNDATKQEALLTGAMQAQGTYIANTLIRDIQNAEMAYFGVTGKAKAYGDAVARYGDQSVVAQQKAKALTNSIIQSGERAHETTGQMAALISKILHIPLSRAIKIVEQGVGNFSITGAPGHELPHHRPTGAAAGWLVPGIGNSDSVPALLTPGEAVVPKYLTPAVAPLLKAHGVPGFASGGVVRTGNVGVLTGAASTGFNKDFISQFTAAMEGAMSSAMKSAIRQAFAAMVGNVGAGVQRWTGLVQKALGMEGLSPMLAGRVLFQMSTESGGNPNAINLSDSNAAAGDPSRGLLQTIMSTFTAYHWPGTSWNIYDPLANIAAAINYARHRYGPLLMSGGMGMGSGHGYGHGTMGASPGWAWTGEFGPELVNFHGGERVLSHGSSLRNSHLAGGGYGSGTGFAPFSSPRRALHSGSGDVYYITVSGDSDPDGAALRIQQKLRKFKRRHGNVNLGLD